MTVIHPKDVAIETTLLANLQKRENYEQYIRHIDFKRVLPNTSLLLKDYHKYFELYPDRQEIVFDEFYTHFTQNWHSKDMEIADVEYYRDYVFPAITNCEEKDVEKALLGLKEKQYIETLNSYTSKGMDVTKIRQLADDYEKEISNFQNAVDKTIHTVETVDFQVLDKTNGIPWFLPTLQNGLMSITAGQFIVVVGDYGTGKSAFVISQVAHTIKHLHKKGDTNGILYINSEGVAEDVIARVLSNLYQSKVLGGFEEIVERHKEVTKKFISTFSPNLLRVVQVSDVPTFESVKEKIIKYKPSLVIIDICDKLAKEEDVLNLKKLYDNLRVLAGAECPIIGTSQSGDTSYFDQETKEVKKKKWLDDHSLYGSKTGKGGAADTIITIGKEEGSNLRYVSVVKKKRGEPVKITCELIDKFSSYKELQW